MVAATWVVASTRISRASSQIAATTVFEWLTVANWTFVANVGD